MAATPPIGSGISPVPRDRGGVTIHTWRAISSPPLQAWTGPRTTLYTYVLVGDIGARDTVLNAATRRAWLALEQLLKETQAGQAIGGDAGRWPPEVLAQANQFCIPAVAGAATDGKRVSIETYDVDLSRDHLNLFRLALKGSEEMTRSLSGVGPFLIASRKPVGELLTRTATGALAIDTGSPMLLVDMTGRHENAMPAYLGAFQETVRSEVVGRTSPGLLREAIGSALLKLNEALPFVAEAHAGTTRLLVPR